MEKTKGSIPMIRQKPSAMRTNLFKLFETLGYPQQQQIRDGWHYLGDGAYKKIY